MSSSITQGESSSSRADERKDRGKGKQVGPHAKAKTVPASMILDLFIVRGSFRTATQAALPAATAGGRRRRASAAEPPTVLDDLPNEVLGTILVLLPVARRYQCQAVSRRWRQLLTSADFRRVVMAHERERLGSPAGHSGVIACALPGHDSLRLVAPREATTMGTRRYGSANNSSNFEVMSIDLSFVDSSFWGRLASSYRVLAAGDGMVCIAIVDTRLFPSSTIPLCVVNPLTRSHRLLPELCIPPELADWRDLDLILAPARARGVHLTANSLTVLVTRGDHRPAWMVMTCNLAAGAAARWTLAQGPVCPCLNTGPVPSWRNQHIVWCNGTGTVFSYDYAKRRVYVHSVTPDHGVVQVARSHPPNRYVLDNVVLVEHRGCVFIMGLVALVLSRQLWRLQISGNSVDWHMVTVLHTSTLDRLTRNRYFGYRVAWVTEACSTGDLLCFRLCLFRNANEMRVRSRSSASVRLGYNMETSQWELVCIENWLHHVHANDLLVYSAHAFELQPNSFVE